MLNSGLMKIQNDRGEELSKGLHSEAEILCVKLHTPFKLSGASYKSLETSSLLNTGNNWSVTVAVQIQMCAVYLWSLFHLIFKTRTYLDTTVRVVIGIIAQFLVQLLVVWYYYNYTFLKASSNWELIEFPCWWGTLPHSTSASPAAKASIPKFLFDFFSF